MGRAAFLVLANSEMVKFPPVVDLTPNALTEHIPTISIYLLPHRVVPFARTTDTSN